MNHPTLREEKENYELIVSLSKFIDGPCYSNEKCMIKNWSLQKKTKVLNFIVNQCSIPHMFCLSVSILLYSLSLLSFHVYLSKKLLSFHVFFIFEIFGHCNVLCNSGSSNINYYDLGLAEEHSHEQESKTSTRDNDIYHSSADSLPTSTGNANKKIQY